MHRRIIASPFISAERRAKLLRRQGYNIGSNVNIRSDVEIHGPHLSIGDHVGINKWCFFDCNGKIVIEDYVRIGFRCMFITSSHTIPDSEIRCDFNEDCVPMPITVKRGSRLMAGVMVRPGVTIERGCVVGMGANVINDTEPNGLYVGNPARRVRDLPVAPSPIVRLVRSR